MEERSSLKETQRFAVPTEPPLYHHPPHKVIAGKRWSLYRILDATFVLMATGFTIWLAIILLDRGASWSFSAIGYLVALWVLLAYVALPRLHQLLTAIYVPDYFMGRTRTGDGLLGDPVNLALDGTAEDIHAAMRAAGWIKADEITLGSAWGIIKSSLLRRSYPEAPVSSLYLLGNRHAFAYQQEVDGNAAQRHHVRFWPVPQGWLLPGGHRVQWLAAGTYDRAVGLSAFTGQVTHKIDADIDVERDYIIGTVRYADPQCGLRVIEDFSTAYHHRNGGGDMVITDGDLPVLDVAGADSRVGTAPKPEPGSGGRRRDRPLPPAGLLFAGAVIVVQVVVLALAWGTHLMTGDSAEPQMLASSLVVFSVFVVCAAALWLLTVFRWRWARIGLMAMCAASALMDLIVATVGGETDLNGMLAAGLSVLILWAVSGEQVREWAMPSGEM